MTQAVRLRLMRALLALPLVCLPAAAHASGFEFETQGARAMGLSDATIAQTVDASAIATNPAGIAFLKRRNIFVGGITGGLSTDVTGVGPYPPAGTLERVDQSPGVAPTFYYSHPIGETVALGIGVDRPFGFENAWDDPNQFTGRFTCVECRLGAWRVRPAAAVRLADRFSIGGGLDILFSEVDIKRRMLASPNPFETQKDVAELTVDGSTTTALGFSLGAVASPNDSITVGLTYRHKMTVTHDATATFVQIPTGTKEVDDAVKAMLPAAQAAEIGLVYPGSIAGGVAWKSDVWTVEADVARTFWGDLDRVTLAFATTSFDSILPQNMTAAWNASLGVERLINEQWAVRGGIGFESSPQPDGTVSPFYFDAHRSAYSLGGSYTYGNLRLDAAVRATVHGGRLTDGHNLYGYEADYLGTTTFAFGASLAYRF